MVWTEWEVKSETKSCAQPPELAELRITFNKAGVARFSHRIPRDAAPTAFSSSSAEMFRERGLESEAWIDMIYLASVFIYVGCNLGFPQGSWLGDLGCLC